MRSGNPALNEETFAQFRGYEQASSMTIEGTATKAAILLAVVVAAASITWNRALAHDALTMPLVIGGLIGGLVFGLWTSFKPHHSPITAPLYATGEGLFLGAISAIINRAYPGIAMQAVGLTFGTLAGLLFAYRTGMIRATENFKLGVFAATSGIFLLYMVSWILRMFGGDMPFIHEAGLIGIGFSVFVVIIAALNLVLDFDFIEKGAAHGSPKYMEWYGAFGLLVTLIWLYLEILRLLAKLQSSDD